MREGNSAESRVRDVLVAHGPAFSGSHSLTPPEAGVPSVWHPRVKHSDALRDNVPKFFFRRRAAEQKGSSWLRIRPGRMLQDVHTDSSCTKNKSSKGAMCVIFDRKH